MTGQIGKISRSPWQVREQLNEKLRNNRSLACVAQWLFEQVAGEDLPELELQKGDAFGKMYAAESEPIQKCCTALSHYRRQPAYRAWLEEQKRHGVVGAIVANLDAVAAVGGKDKQDSAGIGRVALSVIVEKLEKLAGDETTSIDDLTDLTKAIATMNGVMVASQKAELDLRKIALLEKKFNSAQTVTRSGQLTPEQKEQRMKEIFGIA